MSRLIDDRIGDFFMWGRPRVPATSPDQNGMCLYKAEFSSANPSSLVPTLASNPDPTSQRRRTGPKQQTMANVEYLICSFCQGPSSRSLRQKLAPHLSNPACHIRPSDLDWLDKWRLLVPSHVEWDLPLLQDSEFQHEFEAELPKTNVVAKVMWVPSIEGKISDTPEWDDLDGWRTIEFRPRRRAQQQHQQQQTSSVPVTDGYEHLLPPAGGGGISKRTLHAYNDDIEATRLPFHSACLRMLYEACNEVMYSTYATSTVSDVVSAILLPSWREGDVNMDWLSRHRSQLAKQRLIVPWGEIWHPLDPQTNVPSPQTTLLPTTLQGADS